MPPLRTFIFENTNDNTTVTIKAYEREQAFIILKRTVFEPSDFTLLK
jgi:hypothetical protein